MSLLKKFKQEIEKLQLRSTTTVDTKQFDDPLAQTIDWKPMKPGGANFTTHVLKKNSASTYKYAASIGAMLFSGVFILAGLLMLLAGLGVLFEMQGGVQFILVIFGAIFALAGFFFFKHLSTAINFETRHGYLWKGNKRPQLTGNTKDKQTVIYFNEIHAIQVIRERVKGNKTSYYSYEINFVMRDGSRFHVIDHGNHAKIIEDVKILSHMINTPVWDASA